MTDENSDAKPSCAHLNWIVRDSDSAGLVYCPDCANSLYISTAINISQRYYRAKMEDIMTTSVAEHLLVKELSAKIAHLERSLSLLQNRQHTTEENVMRLIAIVDQMVKALENFNGRGTVDEIEGNS